MTLREGLLQWLPAYKGPDVYSRGLDPEGQAFFFLHELEEIIREWSACVYHHTPNDGLADPQVPGLELSPAAMFDHGVARAGYIEVPRDRDLAYEFLKTEWVPIHHYGVELRSCRYRGPALAGLAGQTSPYTGPSARGRWPVQADPDDITRVYFHRPDTRRWSVLTWEHAPAVDFPVSEAARQPARGPAPRRCRAAHGRRGSPRPVPCRPGHDQRERRNRCAPAALAHHGGGPRPPSDLRLRP